MVVEHNRRITWTCPLRQRRDTPLGGSCGNVFRDPPHEGHCGDTIELEGRGHTINSLPQLSRHPNELHKNERCWVEEHRKCVRRYDTTRPWGSTQVCGSMKCWTEQLGPKVAKDRVCIFIVWEDEINMRWWLSSPGSAKYILPITLSTSVSPVSPYTCRYY